MGVGKAAHLVNVIDFGLAKKFRDARTSLHIPFRQDDVHGVGTSLFAAINTHLGVGESRSFFCWGSFIDAATTESSRRDDLESLAYMLIYFLRGTLPWRKLRAPASPPTSLSPTLASHYNPVTATWDLIRDSKLAHEALLTCGLPPEFDVLFRYARGLEFDDLPDYAGLRALFRGLAEREGIKYDWVFDWTVPPPLSHSGPVPGAKGRFCEACAARAERR